VILRGSVRLFVAVVVSSATVSACAGGEPDDTLTIVAYDAFTPAEGIFDEFTAATGYEVEVVTGGDSGTVVSRAILTAGNPEGDVLWGVDNTLLSRARAADLLEQYEPVDTGDGAEPARIISWLCLPARNDRRIRRRRMACVLGSTT